MADLLRLRHRRSVRRAFSWAGVLSLILGLGLMLILVTVWIPDSRSGQVFGMTRASSIPRSPWWGFPR
jgi:hypothetical protein